MMNTKENFGRVKKTHGAGSQNIVDVICVRVRNTEILARGPGRSRRATAATVEGNRNQSIGNSLMHGEIVVIRNKTTRRGISELIPRVGLHLAMLALQMSRNLIELVTLREGRVEILRH
jgi:hypothetical protein